MTPTSPQRQRGLRRCLLLQEFVGEFINFIVATSCLLKEIEIESTMHFLVRDNPDFSR